MKAFKRLKLNYLNDLFFIFISCFFFFYGIFIYYKRDLFLTLTLSVLSTIIVCVIYVGLNVKEKPMSKKHLKAEIEKFSTYISFEDKLVIIDILKKYYLLKYDKVDYDGEKITLSGIKSVVYPLLTIEKTNAKQILDCFKKTPTGYKTIILSTDYTEKAIEFSKYSKEKITLYNAQNIFNSLRNSNMLPNYESVSFTAKRKFTDIIKSVFKKEKAKKFLFFGITLSFSAIYSFFPVYYLVFGSALIIIGLYLKILAPDSVNNLDEIGNL